MRFRKAQSLSNFHRQKHLIEHIVTKFGFKKCCGCEHADECDVFGKIREEFASRSMNLPQDGEICYAGSSIIWNRFIQSQNMLIRLPQDRSTRVGQRCESGEVGDYFATWALG
jgi:hypothetical protein